MVVISTKRTLKGEKMNKVFNWCVYGFRYFVSLIVVGITLALIGLISYQPVRLIKAQEKYTPVIEYINFSGNVYESSQVQPGTFAILRPWSEVETWGKGSIMSYQIGQSTIRLTAWVPNDETLGTFLKSETVFSPPKEWNFLTEYRTTFDPQTMRVEFTPIHGGRDDIVSMLIAVGAITLLVLFLITFNSRLLLHWFIVFRPRLAHKLIFG